MSENRNVYGSELFDKTITEYKIIKSKEVDQYFYVIHDGKMCTVFGAIEVPLVCRGMMKGLENTLLDMQQSDYTTLKIKLELEV